MDGHEIELFWNANPDTCKFGLSGIPLLKCLGQRRIHHSFIAG